MVIEGGGRVDTGGRGTSSKESLDDVCVIVKFGQDSGRTGAQREAFALVMTGESIGGRGRSSDDRLEGEYRLVGGFAGRSRPGSEYGGVGGGDFQRRARTGELAFCT